MITAQDPIFKIIAVERKLAKTYPTSTVDNIAVNHNNRRINMLIKLIQMNTSATILIWFNIMSYTTMTFHCQFPYLARP